MKSAAVLAVLCAIGLAAGAGGEPQCEMPGEPMRRLDLSREDDRAHLESDLGAAERLAARYGQRIAAQPLSPASRASATELGEHARVYCRALATTAIAAAHQLDPATIERVQLTKR